MADIFVFFLIYANNFGNCTTICIYKHVHLHSILMPKWHSQIFYILLLNEFLLIYNHLYSFLAGISALQISVKCLWHTQIFYIWKPHLLKIEQIWNSFCFYAQLIWCHLTFVKHKAYIMLWFAIFMYNASKYTFVWNYNLVGQIGHLLLT